MRTFDSVQIDSTQAERVKYIESLFDESEAEVLFLKPPKQNSGLAETKKLLKNPFHIYNEETTRFKRFNTSPVCGFEIWYEDGEIDFYWYVPGAEIERKYRRQLHNRYSNGQLRASLEKFIPLEEDDYFAGTEYHLKNHYFEPINHKDSNLEFSNIYEDLLSEIDTKDESRVILQVLFKPAEDDWTELHSLTVDDLADSLDSDMKTESKWFGLKTKERPLSSAEKSIPGMVRSQRDEKAFYVNFRIGVLAPTQEEAEREMSEIDDIINYTFESPSGQNFVPARCSTNEELTGLLEDMIARNPSHMYQPKLPRDYLAHKRSGTYKHMIMTADEVASIAHIPNTREVDIEGINWSMINADGTLPSNSEDFVEPDVDEREAILEELQKHSALEGKEDTDAEREDAENEESEG